MIIGDRVFEGKALNQYWSAMYGKVEALILNIGFRILVAEWIHFTLFGMILPTIKLKVYTLGGL